MKPNLKLVNTLKVTLPENSIDSKSMDEIIGRSSKPVTQRLVPHFDDATDDIPRFGNLKVILRKLCKRA